VEKFNKIRIAQFSQNTKLASDFSQKSSLFEESIHPGTKIRMNVQKYKKVKKRVN